jgi:3-deoxy-D-manno-oct-2-ulosonic acid (Kdo) hydroxylase
MSTNTSSPAVIEVTPYTQRQPRWYCEQLEHGKVVSFARTPFPFSGDDARFLLSQKQTGSRFHKNISYRPASDVLKGAEAGADRERLHCILRNFSGEVTQFISSFLAPYAGKLKLDFASFRPLEEQGRDLPLHKRNDLLHVDAFPTRPTHGARILRVFLNINPEISRIWNVGEPFHEFLPKLREKQDVAPLPRNPPMAALRSIASKIGLPVPDRSAYDEYMLFLHDWLKENTDFQTRSPKWELQFAPGSCWMVYTDGVPHAVMSGRYALEQTFIVPTTALVSPELAPVNVLRQFEGTIQI